MGLKTEGENRSDQKEIEYDLARDLQIASEKAEIKKKSEEDKNPYIIKAVQGLGTLVICYIFYYTIKYIAGIMIGPLLGFFGISMSFLDMIAHPSIILISIYVVITGDSIVDRITNRFFG